MKFVLKKSQVIKPQKTYSVEINKNESSKKEKIAEEPKKNNNSTEKKTSGKKTKNKLNENKDTDMDTSDKIALAQQILGKEGVNENGLKVLKRDKGLIERTESSKIILTEDNKELLAD